MDIKKDRGLKSMHLIDMKYSVDVCIHAWQIQYQQANSDSQHTQTSLFF